MLEWQKKSGVGGGESDFEEGGRREPFAFFLCKKRGTLLNSAQNLITSKSSNVLMHITKYKHKETNINIISLICLVGLSFEGPSPTSTFLSPHNVPFFWGGRRQTDIVV